MGGEGNILWKEKDICMGGEGNMYGREGNIVGKEKGILHGKGREYDIGCKGNTVYCKVWWQEKGMGYERELL